MVKMLCRKVMGIPTDKMTAIIITITRPRGNTESNATINRFSDTAEKIRQKVEGLITKKEAADKKVVVITISGWRVAAEVYDVSI